MGLAVGIVKRGIKGATGHEGGKLWKRLRELQFTIHLLCRDEKLLL